MYKDRMKTICVAGAVSGAGKTTIASLLLSRLKGWAAIKLTACEDPGEHKCPKREPCGACDLIGKEPVIEEDYNILSRGDKDTARFFTAGAGKVIWVRAPAGMVPEALDMAFAKLSSFDGVVIEGNHALTAFDADTAVMVLSPDGGFKASAEAVLEKIDIFLIDTRHGDADGVLSRQKMMIPKNKKVSGFNFSSAAEFEASGLMESVNSSCFRGYPCGIIEAIIKDKK
ncbi:MAG: hypothetical protein AUJ75_01260 [Candidatus Omnitrophica bacterium CG1_02_49_10]|nr:MAG: hypothetical protein AUJ75_01260 [Candidatus Omnitrophica bacterium CG1_02_49_10]